MKILSLILPIVREAYDRVGKDEKAREFRNFIEIVKSEKFEMRRDEHNLPWSNCGESLDILCQLLLPEPLGLGRRMCEITAWPRFCCMMCTRAVSISERYRSSHGVTANSQQLQFARTESRGTFGSCHEVRASTLLGACAAQAPIFTREPYIYMYAQWHVLLCSFPGFCRNWVLIGFRHYDIAYPYIFSNNFELIHRGSLIKLLRAYFRLLIKIIFFSCKNRF